MNTDINYQPVDVQQTAEAKKPVETTGAYDELKCSVHAALETYSNVHRGSGASSMVSTHLYEQARVIVLEYLGLKKDQYVVIFCTPRRAELLKAALGAGKVQCLSSQDLGLSIGVRALVVERKALPKGAPFQTGGGTARLVFPDRVIWADAPDRFEAGTPAIVNVVAFARALELTRRYGKDIFRNEGGGKLAAADIMNHDALEQYSGRDLLDALRPSLIGRGKRVPTLAGERPFINLDNGASTPTFAPVWDAVRQTWGQSRQTQQALVREVRSILARVLGAPQSSYDAIFTSNTTEAINLAAESLGKETRLETDPGADTEPVVLNTLLEHNSNELPWRKVPGVSIARLAVDEEGFVDLAEMETLLRDYNQAFKYGNKRIRLVAVSGASNVLGSYNDLSAIALIAHKYGARFLVDAAQMVAHRSVEMERCGMDYLAFSAHKVYAPFGTGVLMARKGLLHFTKAEMESIQSSGEENIWGIAALGKALVLLSRIGMDVIQAEEQVLTGRLLRGLAGIPGLTVYGVRDPDSPRFAQKGGVVAFGLKDMMPGGVAKKLSEQGGIGVRYGCHCAHLLIKHILGVSPFLAQFQGVMLTVVHGLALPGVVRVSLGIENTAEDVDELVRVLGEIARQSGEKVNRRDASKSQAEIKQRLDDFVRAAAERVYLQ